jgi:hypothetical protein
LDPTKLFWRGRLFAEFENFRAAVAWALDSAYAEDTDLAMVIHGEITARSLTGRRTLFADTAKRDVERAVERARRSGSRYASLVMASAAFELFSRGDFGRARDLSGEAVEGVRVSPHPSYLLAIRLSHSDPSSLAADLKAALNMLDEAGAEPWEYGEVHGHAAVVAVFHGNVALAQTEAALAISMSRRSGNPSRLVTGLYGFALASWQSDPISAQTAVEEGLELCRSNGLDYDSRFLALLAQLQARSGARTAALGTLKEGLERAQIDDDRPGVAVCLARGAVVMVTLGAYETAAVFLGAVTHRVLGGRSVVSPNEIPDHNSFVTNLQSQLGDDLYTAATARGAAMTYEQITAFAQAAVEDLRTN